MKKLPLFFTSAILMLMVISCDKKEDVNNDSVSTDDATEIVAMSLSESAMGATSFMGASVDASVNSQSNGMLKVKASDTYTKDTTFSYTSKSGATISYSLNANYSYTFGFDVDNKISYCTAQFTYNGNFSTPKLTSTHTGTGLFTISNYSTTTCGLDGTFTRSSETTTIGSVEKQISSQISLVFTNLVLNKTTGRVQSGTATVTVTGTLLNKGSFSYTGTIVFEGNQSAIITIGSTSYSINLTTGDYEKQ